MKISEQILQGDENIGYLKVLQIHFALCNFFLYIYLPVYLKMISVICKLMMFGLFMAAWRALQDTFPGQPIGCMFHWNQAVWWHVQQFGLSAMYQQLDGKYDYICQLMALPRSRGWAVNEL